MWAVWLRELTAFLARLAQLAAKLVALAVCGDFTTAELRLCSGCVHAQDAGLVAHRRILYAVVKTAHVDSRCPVCLVRACVWPANSSMRSAWAPRARDRCATTG
eukprot:gnl/Chilomastix_cuspidata/11623.p1 GENE.gnl/Chilomastix_cuspidata/11623~~gnl/Chilomastix_cuspidata/11623.p1  ORF type:complete len:104 (-),score=10.31 gnl/Chilomastix_cuspidata/11623:58-369(-)